jgi:outer membrane lipoprotein-sorting protein
LKNIFGKAVPALTGMALYSVLTAGAQSAAAQRPRPAEQAFKNIQVLKGVPENEIQPTMWFFAASLGVRCRYCHEEDNAKREMDTKPQKLMARRMIEMTMALNKTTFGGRAAVTCNTCHRGSPRPVGTPPTGEAGPPELSSAAELNKTSGTSEVPTVDQILSKYEAAMGGASAAQKISNLVIQATVADIAGKTTPVEIVMKAPGSSLMVTHNRDGDAIAAMNGNSGWVTTERGARDMRPSELEAARLEDPMYVTGRVKQVFSDMRAATRTEKVDGGEAFVVSARSLGATSTKLYFDTKSGMLSRLVYNTETVFGPYYTQIDYSDFRDADGLKVPYRWKISRVRGEVSDYRVSDLKLNVPVDEARFTKPSAPPAAAR